MKGPIDPTTQPIERYWYVDGLVEIGTGSIILILGIMFWGIAQVGLSNIPDWLMGLGPTAVIVLAWVVVNKLVNAIKEKVTYPRTGYVAPPQKPHNLFRAALITLFTTGVCLLVIYTAFTYIGRGIIAVIMSVFFACFMVFLAYRFGLRRFYFLAGLNLILGTGIALLHLPDPMDVAAFLSIFGILWAISGAITLHHYLKITHPPIDWQK